jgi:mannosyltransferase
VSETDIGSEPETKTQPKPEPRPSRWAGWLVIAVPAATSAVFGGYELGGPSLWRDEAYTRDAISRSVGQIFTLLGHQDAVHGAYYVLMHVIAAGIGTSPTALRFPSLCAMVVATAFTAAIGRRTAALAQVSGAQVSGAQVSGAQGRGAQVSGAQGREAQASGTPGGRRIGIPALTGLLAGLVFATAPYMTFYAQTARSYAIVTMLATIATYLLLRAYPDGRWRWWLAYGVAIALTGLFNIFALLILPAHAMTLLLTDARGQPGTPGAGRRLWRVPLRWLAVCAGALVVLGPLLRAASGQQEQIAWLTRPHYKTIERLLDDFAGSRELVGLFAVLVLAGLVACCLADNWRPLNPAAVALPWLVVPPIVLIAVSYVKPVYYERYVEFCLPALAILVAAGLAGIVRLASAASLRQRRLTWLPVAVAVLVVAGIAVLLVAPQRAIRQTAARPDNLRLASAIVAAHEQPGDVVFYIPQTMQVLGTGYPAPFLRLRNIALARSPIASGTLTGVEVTSPAVLESRFTDVRRVWVVTGASNYKFPVPSAAVDKEKLALLSGMHVIGHWMAGEVMLTLYARLWLDPRVPDGNPPGTPGCTPPEDSRPGTATARPGGRRPLLLACLTRVQATRLTRRPAPVPPRIRLLAVQSNRTNVTLGGL